MAHIQRRTRQTQAGEVVFWQARYRDPSGRERTRNFTRKGDAQEFLDRQRSDVLRGDWVDPDAGRITIREWAPRWLATKQHRKASTRAGYRDVLNGRVLPRFGDMQLREITRLELETWISEMQAEPLSASRIRNCVNVVKMMLDLAVEHGVLQRNVARPRSAGARTGALELPKVRRSEHRYLDPEELAAVAAAAAEYDPDGTEQVYTLAYAGPRWSEFVALRRRDFEPLRGRLTVRWNAPLVDGVHEVDSTKTDAIATPRVPRFVSELVAQMLERRPSDPDALLFPGERHICKGRACYMLNDDDWRRNVWQPACRDAGIGRMKPHDLRHTAASLLIAVGADPKAVQEQLGHSTITVTYNTYGHLFERHLDGALDVLDQAARKAATDIPRTQRGATVLKLAPDDEA